jgi:hypothetical protein
MKYRQKQVNRAGRFMAQFRGAFGSGDSTSSGFEQRMDEMGILPTGATPIWTGEQDRLAVRCARYTIGTMYWFNIEHNIEHQSEETKLIQ